MCYMKSFSQAGQDIFVRKVLKNKMNGHFLEIGSNDPIKINNTFVLEKQNNWTGIMVEIDHKFLNSYKTHRPNSIHVIQNAVEVDYLNILSTNNFPTNLDYLQIDLEVSNKSTINVLLNLNKTVFNIYKFAVVTFEHDIYTGDYYDTRNTSRNIFENRGYVRVFSDIKNEGSKFEDWYVHPELVDMKPLQQIITDDSFEWSDAINLINLSIIPINDL